MPTTPQFRSALEALNPAQRQAVETIEGPVMVMAGPGTGKTQVLTLRIAHILLSGLDIRPENILALTYTDAAAKTMRSRLIKMIGKDGYYVNIGTFHSFCSGVIAENGEYFPLSLDSAPLTPLEQHQFLQQIFTNTSLPAIQKSGNPFYYIKPSLEVISQLKKEGLTPESFSELIDREEQDLESAIASGQLKAKGKINQQRTYLAKNRDLVTIYSVYNALLRRFSRYDFDDMIMFVLAAFEQYPDLLAKYQEQYQYFLVDEYQDTNSAQNKVVSLLASHWGEQANLFVVGDPHQSIYRFQGASLENIHQFYATYPAAAVITLTDGYRCSQHIYNAAQAVISGERNSSQDSPLSAAPPRSGSQLTLFEGPSDDHETIFIMEEIKKLLVKKVPLEEIAILYKHNADAHRFMTALDRLNIPYELEGGVDIFLLPLILQLLNFLRLINVLGEEGSDAVFWQVVWYDWLNFSRLELITLSRTCSEKRLNIWQLLEDKDSLVPTFLQDFYQQLLDLKSQEHNQLFLSWLEKCLHSIGFLDHLIAHQERLFLLAALRTLFDQVRSLNTTAPDFSLSDFCKDMAIMSRYHLPLKVTAPASRSQSLKLCTVHSAKGREWSYVFLPELIDGKWGGGKKRSSWHYPAGILVHTQPSAAEQEDDERRLLYVAISRAKTQVFLSYASQYQQNHQLKDKNLSEFIADLEVSQPDSLHRPPADIITPDLYQDYLLKVLSPPPEPIFTSKQQRDFFSSLISDFRLSATALNDYLRDRQRFVYRHILRVPEEITTSALAFGNAVHSTLNFIYTPFLLSRRPTSPAFPPPAKIHEHFTHALDNQLLTSFDKKLRLKDGQTLWTDYIDTYLSDSDLPAIVSLEETFGRQRRVILDEDIILYGRIDRIDLLDAAANTVSVIDYKTGHPKSRNELFCATATSQSDLSARELALPDSIKSPAQRQLLFYKLLTSLDSSFPYDARLGIIDFVEKKDRKTFSRHEITFTDSDLEDLKDLIREVMAEIRNLDWLTELQF
ncbi:ATP-dependent helicase [Microgenomates group bacterium]|nr:ATP-dependent helicase [Microgenomates group bacterium]